MDKKNAFTQEDLQFIKDNYYKMTLNELSEKLKKKPNSVSEITKNMGLKKQTHVKWTEEEIQFVKDNYINMTSLEMSKHINHSVSAINTLRNKLKLVRARPWNKKEIEYIKNNFINMTHEEMGKQLNRTEQAVRAKCFDLDLYKKELPWTQEEIDYVKQNYLEDSTANISSHLNRTKSAVKLKAERMGLKKYPYTCDYHYFDIIDTEEKAYWLGFLSADGWISKNSKSNAGVVGIELQYGDISHLKKFNKSIKGNYKITDRWRSCSLSGNDKKNHSCILRIFSMTMYESLKKRGFTNEKTFDCSIPPLQKHLLRHWIRGYFDGNGCFGLSKNKLCISFCTASKQLSNDLIELLKKDGFDFHDYSYIDKYNTIIYVPSLTSKKQKIAFLNYLYKDCIIYLDRKYKKYIKALEMHGTKPQ